MGITSAVAVMRAARGDAAAPAPPGREPAYLLYYRGPLDAANLRELPFEGDVAEPGAWGRLMNGGASLTVDGRRVEVIYRDLDAVEHWVAEASEGRFEIDAVDGWLAGMPTYVLVGELASCEALPGGTEVQMAYVCQVTAAAAHHAERSRNEVTADCGRHTLDRPVTHLAGNP